MILYGAPVRDKIKEELSEKVKTLSKRPVLAIVQVGDRPDSNVYIKNKIKFGEEIGVQVVLNKFEENISEEILEEKVKELVEDKNINGIIVQLPLPASLDSERVINLLPKSKDADGLTTSPPTPLIESEAGEDGLLVTPATARAVMSLLDYYKIPVQNKKVAVIGRSKLAGGPIAQALEKRGALVSVCHKGTENIEKICKKSNILISAAGQVGLVNKKFVHKNQVVVDVGINKITFGPKEITPPTPLTLRGEPNGKIIQDVSAKPKFVGDVNFTEVEPIVKAITPVPGGVGPLTVACLFQNLLDLVSIK